MDYQQKLTKINRIFRELQELMDWELFYVKEVRLMGLMRP
jgi:hypothetical protein